MKVSDFTFDLPEELIAQDPLEDRSSSRLLTLDILNLICPQVDPERSILLVNQM